jgi:hypothetical protein
VVIGGGAIKRSILQHIEHGAVAHEGEDHEVFGELDGFRYLAHAHNTHF